MTRSIQQLPTPERLLAILDAMASRSVLVVGDLLADIYLTGRTSRISREAPVLILKRTGEFTVPGQAANTAANAASLDLKTSLVGVLGSDKTALALMEGLDQRGVRTFPVTVPGARTLAKMRVLAGGSHTTVQQVIRIDDDDPPELTDLLRQELTNQVIQGLADANATIVCDYGYGLLTDELWKMLVEHSQRTGIPLILDSRYGLTQYHGASQITPNEEEGLAVCGLNEPITTADMPAVGQMLRDRTKAATVLLTRGNEGMVLYLADGTHWILPVYGSQDCRDVTGAGDTVAATNAAAQATGATLLESAILANIAGSVVVQKVGTATATRNEIRQALQQDYPTWITTVQQ